MTENNTDHAKNTAHALTFRAVEAGRVYGYLRAGDSCQVVGIGSSGKSHFLRSLLEDALQETYLGPGRERFLFIYLDANKLLRRDDWGVYELMLHQLLVELETCGSDAASRVKAPPVAADAAGRVKAPLNAAADTLLLETLQAVDALHGRAVAAETLHLALRYLDRALNLVIKRDGRRVVYLFDEFDDLARELPALCFSALRALRDDHKYALMYLTASRRPISHLRENPAEIESFDELLSGNIIWLGAYSPADARDMVARVARRNQAAFAEDQVAQMLEQTGCHPGLLRGVIRLALKGGLPPLEQAVFDASIQDECQQIWRSLPVLEQRALMDLAGGRAVEPFAGASIRLREKGLLLASPAGEQIFAPLFAEYIRKVKPVAGALVEIDRAHRRAWVQGRRITDLTAQEFNCLDYLAQHPGEPCSAEEIGRYCYSTARGERKMEKLTEPVEGDDKIYQNSVEAMIKRLRKKIEPEPNQPRFIKTVRGVGYVLEDGGEF
jgi:DNA-binding winged helix-turn-helix (wHTH) protein